MREVRNDLATMVNGRFAFAKLKFRLDHVMHCNGPNVSGLANAGVAAAPIIVRRENGNVLKRCDLELADYPRFAGYSVASARFAHTGESIEILFPSGGHQAGLPCRVR